MSGPGRLARRTGTASNGPPRPAPREGAHDEDPPPADRRRRRRPAVRHRRRPAAGDPGRLRPDPPPDQPAHPRRRRLGAGRQLRRGGGPVHRWAPRLLFVYGVGLVIGGLFVPDPALGYPVGTPDEVPDSISWHGW